MQLGIFFCLFFTTTHGALGLDTSDADILDRAIKKHKSNIERIMTWTGKVVSESYESGPEPGTQFERFEGRVTDMSEMSFSNDIVTGQLFCRNRILQSSNKTSHNEYCTFFENGVSYEISRYMDVSSWQDSDRAYESKLAIKAVDRENLSEHLFSQFLPIERTDFNGKVIDALNTFLRVAKTSTQEDTSNINVYEQETLLTIELLSQGHLTRYVVDMSRGAMPTELVNIHEGKGVHWKCRLQNVDGIWIPQETMVIMDFSGGVRLWTKDRWEENVLNKPIDQSVFSLESLGLHRGSRVYDYRTDEEYVISDDKYPPFPTKTIVPKRHAVTSYALRECP